MIGVIRHTVIFLNSSEKSSINFNLNPHIILQIISGFSCSKYYLIVEYLTIVGILWIFLYELKENFGMQKKNKNKLLPFEFCVY